MPRLPILKYHRGTLTLHPPPKSKGWFNFAQWDNRLEKFAILGIHYRPLVETLQAENTAFIDEAKEFVNRIVPAKYQEGKYVAKRGRILVNDEYLTPDLVLKKDPYFEEFRNPKKR